MLSMIIGHFILFHTNDFSLTDKVWEAMYCHVYQVLVDMIHDTYGISRQITNVEH